MGSRPYDIYVRWKPLHEQPIGWNPDLNDGVRLNIRPFITAGVLRSRVNVKWKKDRGHNPDGSERVNDIHLTLAEKRAARRGEGNVTTLPSTKTFLDALADAIEAASAYNSQDQAPPAAILWPDKDRQWEALLPLLKRPAASLCSRQVFPRRTHWPGLLAEVRHSP